MNEALLQQLANQLFKVVPGDFLSELSSLPINHHDVIPPFNQMADFNNKHDEQAFVRDFEPSLSRDSKSPITSDGKVTSQSGISPSAIYQGNAVDLSNPQTSLPDPNSRNNSLKEKEAFPVGHFDKSPYETFSQLSSSTLTSPTNYYFIKESIVEHSLRKHKSDVASFRPSFGFDVNVVRLDFPIFKQEVNGYPLVWFDNAATTQKPNLVVERITKYYETENSNIHRAAHELAARSTDAYENARLLIKNFIGAVSVNEIVFVRGATEAINLVANSWGEQYLSEGDEILVSHLEHHANIVPWQLLSKRKGLTLKVIPVDESGQILIDEYKKLLTNKTKLVSVSYVSNALGTITPVDLITRLAHDAGAKVLVDGAQSVSHIKTDVQTIDCDWFVFSGHKMFGPTGIGVLYGKEFILNETQPWQGGGNMIQDVTFEKTIYHKSPARFEAGTGNIADAVGLGAAVEYINKIGIDQIYQYEHFILQYATALIQHIPGLHIIGNAKEKTSVLSFVLDGYTTEEVGKELNKHGIAVRSGHHCAQPILRRFNLESTVRPSFAFYNTCAEVDLFVDVLYRLSDQKYKK